MKKLIEFISFKILSPFNWTRLKYLLKGKAYDISAKDRDNVRSMCELQTYLWLTRRDSHLTTYLINFSDFALGCLAWARSGFKGPRPKLGYYAHAFLNVDDFTFIEAISKGVVSSYFDEVFNVDAFCGLVPKNLTAVEWNMFSKKFVEESKKRIGSRYDAVFNLNDEAEVSCIELIRVCLKHAMTEEEYSLRFKNFEALINQKRNLTPDMLKDCGDFETVIEIRG